MIMIVMHDVDTDLVPDEPDNVPGVRVAPSQETQGKAGDLCRIMLQI